MAKPQNPTLPETRSTDPWPTDTVEQAAPIEPSTWPTVVRPEPEIRDLLTNLRSIGPRLYEDAVPSGHAFRRHLSQGLAAADAAALETVRADVALALAEATRDEGPIRRTTSTWSTGRTSSWSSPTRRSIASVMAACTDDEAEYGRVGDLLELASGTTKNQALLALLRPVVVA
jgi:hypothetical protein